MKMASSQLEVVSSSPFGCILRDHNRNERCRDRNGRSAQSVFDKNLNDLVRDHINVASWVTDEQASAKTNANASSRSSSPIITRQSPVLDRWVTRQSQDVTLTTIDKHVNEATEPLSIPLHSNTSSPTTTSTPNATSSSSCSRTFDAGEIERVRIVDIIKRLKTGSEVVDDHEHSNNENKHCSTSDQAEHRCFSMVTNSPRLIRGRQAYHDLLVQIDRDKNKELHSIGKRQPVSKFSQRGRIQSMLRLKSLQRCLTIQDKCRPQLPGNRLPQGSTFMHRREKFRTGREHIMTGQNVSASPKCLQKDKTSTYKPQREDTHCKKGQSTEPVNCSTRNKNEDVHEQAKQPSDTIQQKTRLEARCAEPLEIAKATEPLEGRSENEVIKEQCSNSQHHLLLGSQETAETETITRIEVAKPEQETMDITTSLNSNIGNEIGDEEESGGQQHICLDSRPRDIVESSSTMSYINDNNENEVTEEEEKEDDYSQYFEETNDYDWFSNISRPRSYWEGLRKAWYQEVLNTTSTNEDIRQLLERGRVSTLLGSDFRESMDRLLTCHVQIQADGAESQQDLEDHEETRSRGRVSTLISNGFLEKMKRLMSSRVQIQQEDGAESKQEVEGKEGMVEPTSYQGVEDEEEYEGEEERSLSSNQCQEEANNDFNHSSSSLQMASPSALMIRSWSFQDDNETGNDYEQGASVSSPPTQPSQAQSYQDTRHSSSSTTHPSLEMELICDLRGHVEQLQNEISELRKSFVSCMGMQMKMQHFSLNHEVQSDEDSADRTPWKRTCFICHEMQVDSLLYRCGHMCTCLKCGQELEWRRGKCPICQAPILDVVPAK